MCTPKQGRKENAPPEKDATAEQPTISGNLKIILEKKTVWEVFANENMTFGALKKKGINRLRRNFSVEIWDLFLVKKHHNADILSLANFPPTDVICNSGDEFPLNIIHFMI